MNATRFVALHPGPPLASTVGMRSSLMLSILVAAALGACGQSLTTDKTGTGGSGTATGGATGGSGPGAGGSGGSVVAVCNTLTAEYQSALTAAESCQVGASGQCQQIVERSSVRLLLPDLRHRRSRRSPRSRMPGKRLAARRQSRPALSFVQPRSTAPASRPTEAAPASVRTCRAPAGPAEPAARRHGRNQRGRGLAGGRWPQRLRDARLRVRGRVDRRQELHGRRRWPVRDVGPPFALAVPRGLHEFVTDSSVLDSIRTEWDAAGCGNVPVSCPRIACPPAVKRHLRSRATLAVPSARRATSLPVATN